MWTGATRDTRPTGDIRSAAGLYVAGLQLLALQSGEQRWRYREAERPGGAPASDVQGHFLTHATQYYAERETAASHNLKEKAVQKSRHLHKGRGSERLVPCYD